MAAAGHASPLCINERGTLLAFAGPLPHTVSVINALTFDPVQLPRKLQIQADDAQIVQMDLATMPADARGQLPGSVADMHFTRAGCVAPHLPGSSRGFDSHELLVLTTRGRIIRLGAESGELVREVCTAKRAMVSDSPALQLVCAHDGVATSLSASPNEVYLATCASDGLIKVGVHH